MEKENLLISPQPRIFLIGSVNSSYVTLKKLVEHNLKPIGVLGLEPKNTELVSGYINMSEFCANHEIPYHAFTSIKNENTKKIIAEAEPDLLFVIGLSQIIPNEILSIPKLGNIGFHPTKLPKGRGRAPIAWLILEEAVGAANFFLMGEGVDDGPIFVQKTFTVDSTDTASSVEIKILRAIEEALDQWLPDLKNGRWNFVAQDELDATYYGKRTPADGWINWTNCAKDIDKLIRASGWPHPGAYTFYNDRKIIIIGCHIETELKIKGVVGRILLKRQNEFLVQTGDGIIWISKIVDEEDKDVNLKVGDKLGYYSELEIYTLKQELKTLKSKIGI